MAFAPPRGSRKRISRALMISFNKEQQCGCPMYKGGILMFMALKNYQYKNKRQRMNLEIATQMIIKFRAFSVAACYSSLTLGGINLYHSARCYNHLHLLVSHNTYPPPILDQIYIYIYIPHHELLPEQDLHVTYSCPIHYRYWAYGRCSVNVIEQDNYS